MERDHEGSGFARWPILLLIAALVGGATATQVARPGTSEPSRGEEVVRAPALLDQVAATPALIATLLGIEPPADGSMAAVRTEALRHGIVVEQFLVATLPDYVDSNSGWTFDATLDAVHRAATAADYVLDRFWLPDWMPSAQAGSDPAAGALHEVVPGVVLFRRVDPDTRRAHMLAVLVVTETPTAGVHLEAFLAATRAVAGWYQEDEPYTLRVLGPTFSGASFSLRRAIDVFVGTAEHRPQRVQVLSGSATSRSNQALLTFDAPTGAAAGVPVTFAATVRADDVMLHALHDHLVKINPEWQDGAGVVLLVESNTGYGQGFAPSQADLPAPGRTVANQTPTAAGDSQDHEHPDGQQHQHEPNQEQSGQGPDQGQGQEHGHSLQDPFAKALRIAFPIHISRLRAEGERARTAAAEGGTLPGSTLQDVGPGTDQLPSMTPATTAASIDALVQSILATIRREEYPAIGIFATDKRDHLFLAERIIREVPNALLFTAEADLIYIHPSFRSFLRGAIVASSYPLFNATQTLTSPHLAGRERQQFSTMAAQGIYNAVLKLLGRDELLLDYLSPGCMSETDGRVALCESDACRQLACRWPPVWISIVGRDGLWPIDRHHEDAHTETMEAADPYTAAIDAERLRTRLEASDAPGLAGASREGGPARALLHVATWMKAAFALLLVALAVHLVAYLAEVGPVRTGPGPGRPSWWRRVRARLRLARLTGWARQLPVVHPLPPSDRDERAQVVEHRLFLLVATTILWFLSVWATRLFLIWWSGDVAIPEPAPATPSDAPVGWDFTVWDGLYGGILALLVVESIVSVRHRRAAAPAGWVSGMVVTGVGLVLAVYAGLGLAGFLATEPWSNVVSARLLLARTVNTGNWVSPAAPLLAISAVLYLWAIWNVRQLLVGGWTYRRVSQLLELMTGREARLRDEVSDVMVSPWRRQNWRCLAIPFGLVVLFALYVPRWYTPDGQHFDAFLWWGSLLTMFLVAHSLATTLQLWLLVRRVLRHLTAHPIAAAFTRVAAEPFDWRLSLTPPRALELKPLARKARSLRLDLQKILSPVAFAGLSMAPGERRRASSAMALPIADISAGSPVDVAALAATTLGVRREDMQPAAEALRIEMPEALDTETAQDSNMAYFTCETWKQLVKLSDGLIPVLRFGFWHRGSTAATDELTGWYRAAEDLVGMQAAFVLRDLLARLVSGMTVTIAGATLALTSHLFYSFPGRSAMLAFDWILIALSAAAAAFMLLRLENDRVLNALWSRTPGGPVWTGGFVYRLALYGAVPIVTLFAWQFPEVGTTLFSWMEPLQKAIP